MASSIAYLGPRTIHNYFLRSSFRNLNINYIYIPDYITYLHDNMNIIGHSIISRVASQVHGVGNPQYLEHLRRILVDNNIDTIYAHWGTIPLPEIISIRKLKFNVKIFINVLCHPLGLDHLKVFSQNMVYRRAVQFCDGIVLPSQKMMDYFESKIFGKSKVDRLVFPPYFSSDFYPCDRISKCSYVPNLVFLGRTDWWAGQPTDDVSVILDTLCKMNIHIYHSQSDNKFSDTKYIHIYNSKSFKDIVRYATQFNASLVTYNLEKCQCTARFEGTIPDRLITSVAAGIPVAIPSRGYDACREYLSEYEATVEFDSLNDLALKLSDRVAMESLSHRSVYNSKKYLLENKIRTLLNFFNL